MSKQFNPMGKTIGQYQLIELIHLPENRFPLAGNLNDALARALTSRSEPRATSVLVTGIVTS